MHIPKKNLASQITAHHLTRLYLDMWIFTVTEETSVEILRKTLRKIFGKTDKTAI